MQFENDNRQVLGLQDRETFSWDAVNTANLLKLLTTHVTMGANIV